MNAAKQAQSIELISKIANLGVIFRTEFIQAIPDFNPWLSHPKTQSMSKVSDFFTEATALQNRA